uniref:Zinc finger CCHC domain-containing protein 8 n=1 Tax=Lygus hesperus TaxID=30085 RepID=A0A146MBS3_LYGHE
MEEERSDTSCLFSISTEPEEGDHEPSKILYYKEFSIFPEEDENTQPKGRFRCFNCGTGIHNMSECPEKRDSSAVSRNRAAFMYQRQQQPGLSNSREFKRYHIEIEGVLRGEAAPGVISDELREAMGLKRNQLPPYIYKMRVMGYPPGWLEEAKISNSGINMINSKGERVPDAEEEEGEIYVIKTKFDFSKIIDYPGYNVWPAADTINETELYGVPQMEYSHSKKAFIDYLKEQMEEAVEFVPPVDMSIDMEAEEVEDGEVIEGQGVFVPPLPGDNPPDVPPPPPDDPPTPPPPGVESSKEEDVDEEEEEGEIKKKAGKKGTKRTHEDDTEPTLVKSPRTSLLQDSVHSADVSAAETNESSTAEEYSTPNQTLDSSFGRVISVEMGTPSLKIHSPFTSLPPTEAFSKGISDVINFENLPNSTGKYENNLKDVLKSVRQKLSIFRTNNDCK